MPDTCILCEHHVWCDHKEFHICYLDEDQEEKRVDAKPCTRYRLTRRGRYGSGLTNEYDTNDIESGVKEDKFTRRKK